MPLAFALRKDLLVQWRSRAEVIAVVVFGIAALLLFSFAVGPDRDALRPRAAGFLWVAMLLSSTLTLSESFRTETEQRAFEGLLLMPVPARTLYYAKALANGMQLSVLGLLLVPVIVVLYDVTITDAAGLAVIVLLGAAGVSAPGTLYAGMAAQAKAGQTLLPLLLFPLVVPVLLAAVKASALLMAGDPMGQTRSWTSLLASFDLMYWALGGLVFDRVVED